MNYHEIRERVLISGWPISQEGDTPRGPFLYFLNEGHPGAGHRDGGGDAGPYASLSRCARLRESPRTYWRLFQLANESLWPLQIPVLLIGAAILAMLFRPRAWADRAIPAVLAGAWLCASVGFLWMHYAAIN